MSMLSRIGCFRQCYRKTCGHWQFYQESIDAVNVIKKLAVITHNKNNKLFLVAPSPWVLKLETVSRSELQYLSHSIAAATISRTFYLNFLFPPLWRAVLQSQAFLKQNFVCSPSFSPIIPPQNFCESSVSDSCTSSTFKQTTQASFASLLTKAANKCTPVSTSGYLKRPPVRCRQVWSRQKAKKRLRRH